MRRTFKVKQKSALCQTGLSSSERDCHVTTGRIDVNNLTSQGSTVTEERPVTGSYLQIVVAATATFDVEFKVEQSDADSLTTLYVDGPAALGIHVVLVWIVRACDVAAVVQSDRLAF